MAKKQTRRSISISRGDYDTIKDFCARAGVSMSSFVQMAARAAMATGRAHPDQVTTMTIDSIKVNVRGEGGSMTAPRTLREDRGAILRMAGNIAGPLMARIIHERGSDEDDESMILFVVNVSVDTAIGIVQTVDERIAAEPKPEYVKPPPTSLPGPGEPRS